MGLRRILLETKRQLSYRSGLMVLAVLVAAAGALGVTMGQAGLADAYLTMYVILPVAFAPMMARAAVRDRETALAPVLATTPATRGVQYAGHLAFGALIMAIYLVGTLPVAVGMVWATGNAVGEVLAPFLGWYGLVGAGMVAWGLLAGYAAGRSNTGALSGAFGAVVGALLFPVLVGPVVSEVASAAARNALVLVAHLVPTTWAFDALGVHVGPYPTLDAVPPALGGAVLALGLLAVSLLVVTRLQGVETWQRWRAAPGALAATLLIAGLVVGVAGAPPVLGSLAGEDDAERVAPSSFARVSVQIFHDGRSFEGERYTRGEWVEATLVVVVAGLRNDTRTFSDVDLAIDGAVVEFPATTPVEVEFTEPGYQNTTYPFRFLIPATSSLGHERSQAVVSLVFDGEPLSWGAGTAHVAGVDNVATTLGGVVAGPALITGLVGWYAPRRWNRWT